VSARKLLNCSRLTVVFHHPDRSVHWLGLSRVIEASHSLPKLTLFVSRERAHLITPDGLLVDSLAAKLTQESNVRTLAGRLEVLDALDRCVGRRRHTFNY
jgi:hypothetical protein